MKLSYFGRTWKSCLSVIVLAFMSVLIISSTAPAQELKTINLPSVNKDRGASVMDALSNKASANSLSDRDLSMQDLSDLLWAAAGINRPDEKKRTYSTAMNTQDVDVYVLLKEGAYIYDYENHALNPVTSGDFRQEILFKMGGAGGKAPGASGQPGDTPEAAGQPGNAGGEGRQGGAPEGNAGGPPAGAKPKARLSTFAVDLILVSEPSKYRAGSDDLKKEWGAFSAGMIAQNVMLFCSANNMGTHPRAAFDKANIRSLLKLRDTQNPVIELPVGYLQ